MRKLVVLTFVTLDGVMQAPGAPEEDTSGGFNYGGWTVPYFDDVLGQVMDEQMGSPYDLLLGRRTYEIFASYWPHHQEEEPGPGINKATKYVVSHKDRALDWGPSHLITGDVVAEIQKLKSADGEMLQVHGSSVLIQTLLKNDLIDELWLKIFPVTLGAGKRLFGDGIVPAAFALEESKTTSTGVIVASFKRAGEVKTGSFA